MILPAVNKSYRVILAQLHGKTSIKLSSSKVEAFFFPPTNRTHICTFKPTHRQKHVTVSSISSGKQKLPFSSPAIAAYLNGSVELVLALSVPLRELEIRFVRTLGVHIESIRLEHTLTIAALESNNSISDANQMISPSFVYRELARSREMRSEASINHPERTFFAKTPSIVLQDLNEY